MYGVSQSSPFPAPVVNGRWRTFAEMAGLLTLWRWGCKSPSLPWPVSFQSSGWTPSWSPEALAIDGQCKAKQLLTGSLGEETRWFPHQLREPFTMLGIHLVSVGERDSVLSSPKIHLASAISIPSEPISPFSSWVSLVFTERRWKFKSWEKSRNGTD